MIKHYDRTIDYKNGLEIAWVFLLGELHHLLIYSKIFDVYNESYNYRRLFGFSLVFLFVFSVMLLVGVASLLYIGTTTIPHIVW